MSKEILSNYKINITKTIFLMLAVLYVFIGAASAEKTKLTMQDAPLLILKDSSVTKKINGIPDVAGSISLKIKWHVLSFIPNTFNKLKIELLHGSRVLLTRECYSQHSDKTPKCSISKTIDETEANASGDYKLRVTNNNKDDINGFNILKEITDINPAVANIESTFERSCNIENPFLSSEVNISSFSTVEKDFFSGVGINGGVLHLKAKWHGLSLNPSVSSFNSLKVEVLHNGSVIKSDEGYSIHSNEKGKTNKLDIIINVPATSADQIGGWKLRITNSSADDVTGFNIERGRDPNPFVPFFRSTFDPCR